MKVSEVSPTTFLYDVEKMRKIRGKMAKSLFFL
jgi:hypothetical protein